MKVTKPIMINAGISLFIVILGCFITYTLTKSSELETRRYESDKKALTVILQDAWKYSDYSTVDWNKVDNIYVHAYHECNFKYEPDPEIGNSSEISHILCNYQERLENAKNDFKKLTTEARIMGSDNIVKALNSVEIGFDEVFQKITQQTYYGRVLIDVYNEVMPWKFSELEKSLKNTLQK